MKYRDLPYYEGIRAKTPHEYKLHENKHENHTNHVHTFRRWSITWSQFVLTDHTKHWLIHHSMACTAIYSSHDFWINKNGGSSLDYGSVKKISHHSSLQVSLRCYSGYLTFPL